MFTVWELSNVLFGDTIVPIASYWGRVVNIRNIILLGSTMKKRNSVECKRPTAEATLSS